MTLAARAEAETFKIPPPLEKHNLTFDELRKYNGRGEDGRICIAVLGKVFDCSKGRRFYGPDGPYSTFAGRDATRALATFEVNAVKGKFPHTICLVHLLSVSFKKRSLPYV